MRDFFHGWRRKVGCVTLVMAFVVTTGWARSLLFWDSVYFPAGGRTHQIVSLRGGLGWSSWEYTKPERGFKSMDAKFIEKPFRDFMMTWDKPYYASWNVRYWYGYYWQAAIPLTLLSAYLILWKPRKWM